MEKKNLLIFGGYFSLDKGGIENTSYLFADYFRKYYNVFTISIKNGCSPGLEDVHSEQSKYNRANPLCAIDFYKKSVALKKKYGIDYVLAVQFSYALACVFLKWMHGIDYGVLVHGREAVKWPKENFKEDILWRVFYYPLRWLIYKNASNIFCNTNFTKILTEKVTTNRNITVINPPISFQPDPEEAKMNKNSFLLSIGRLDERKGFQNVIKALPKVKGQIPNIKYYLGGVGPSESKMKAIAKELHVEDNVVFLGRVSEENKSKMMKECSLFLMPSYMLKGKTDVEGFGLSLLEANSYGRFVISTKCGGIPEAVIDGETGFLVEQNNVEELAEAVLKYFSPDFVYDPQKCKDWSEKRFIGNIAEQYHLQISSTLINRK